MIRRLFLIVLLFLGFPLHVHAFNLSATCSSGGSWDAGGDIYEASRGATIGFACTPSSGTAPYTYCWDFGNFYGFRHEADDTCHSTSQNPSNTYNAPGKFQVWVTVTDDDSNTESAVLIVKVTNSSTTYNVSEQAGANITARLQAALDAATSNGEGRVSFDEAGTLTSEFTVSGHDIEIDGNGQALNFNAGAQTASMFLTNKADDPIQGLWIHGLDVTNLADRTTYTITIIDDQPTKYWATVTIQDSTFTDFGGCSDAFYNGASVTQVLRCNFEDWGGIPQGGGGSVLFPGGQNVLLRQIYSYSNQDRADWNYTSGDRSYIYIEESYAYSTVTGSNQETIQWYGSCSTDYAHRYVRDNIFLEVVGRAFKLSSECANIHDLYIVRNYIANTSSYPIAITPSVGATDVAIKDNWFWDLTSETCGENPNYRECIRFDAPSGSYTNFTITGNTDGTHTGEDPNCYDYPSNHCEWCTNGDGDAYYESYMMYFADQPNTTLTNWTVSGNSDTDTRPQWNGVDIFNDDTPSRYDPGVWIFTAPVNNGDYATGYLGSAPRWPLSQGGLSQGEDGSHFFTEVDTYENRVNFSGSTNIRYRNIYGNWSVLASYSGGTGSLTNTSFLSTPNTTWTGTRNTEFK